MKKKNRNYKIIHVIFCSKKKKKETNKKFYKIYQH